MKWQILVITDSSEETGTVVYRERISAVDLESAHSSGRLVERVAWALQDAKAIEHRGSRDLPRHPIGEFRPPRSRWRDRRC